MRQTGFYFSYRQDEVYGLAFAIVYIAENKDFQISLQLFDLTLAVGYVFE